MRVLYYNTQVTSEQVAPQVGDIFYLTRKGAVGIPRLIVEITDKNTYGTKHTSWVKFIDQKGGLAHMVLWHECVTVEHEFE